MSKPVRAALDSNILVYAAGVNDRKRAHAAISLITSDDLQVILPLQVFGEFYNVCTRKYRLPPPDVLDLLERFRLAAEIVTASERTFDAAFDLAASAGLQIWDALILASAAEALCSVLYSEDLQHGFAWRGVRVVNPFVTAGE